jgi:hypothetical protein
VCQPWTIATGETSCAYCGPSWLAVAGGYLFWTVYDPKGTVWRADLADGGVTELAKNQNLAYPIAADSSFVYWGTSTQIVRCALTGCSGAPQPVGAQTYAVVNGIALNADFVYWTEAGGAVWVSDKTLTPTVTRIASGQYYPTGIAVADAFYWTNAGSGKAADGAMMRLADGGTPKVVAPAQRNPQLITAYAGRLYWTEMGTGPNYTDGAVMTCVGDPCTASVLAGNQAEPLGIAADATGVYWAAQGDHAIFRCDPSACKPTRVADAQAPYAVALDDRSVYWTDLVPGSVVRLAKP